jgi:hypothetical protein
MAVPRGNTATPVTSITAPLLKGGHPDVVVQGGRAFVFYFTHPGRRPEIPESNEYEKRRSSIQVTELFYEDGQIVCRRNEPVKINLKSN